MSIGIRRVACLFRLLLVLSLGVLQPLAAIPQRAQAAGDMPITTFTSYGGHDLVEDATGKLHLVLVDAGNIKYASSTNQGASWTVAPLSVPENGRVLGPTLAVDQNDAVFIFYFFANNAYSPAWDYTLNVLSNVTGAWTVQTLQSNATYTGNGHESWGSRTNAGIQTRLAFVDSANQVHLMGAHYGWNGYGGTVWEFVRGAGPSGTWVPKVVAYHNHNLAVDCATTYHETFAIGPADKITGFSHVPSSGSCNPPGANTIFRFEKTAGVWGAGTAVSNVSTDWVQPLRLAYDGLGRLHAIYQGSDGQTVYHSQDWGTPEAIFTAPSGFKLWQPSLHADAAGNLTLVYNLRQLVTPEKYGELYKREKTAGGAWGPAVALTSYGAGHDEYQPTLARRTGITPTTSSKLVYADVTSRTPTWGGQLYFLDLASPAWTGAGAMRQARGEHTAVLLANGKVLVLGGDNGGPLNSAELFDPTLGTFDWTGAMSIGRFNPAAARLPNGKVLVTGGWTGSNRTANAELYDPSTGAFTAHGSMVYARQAHTASVLGDGKVLLTGGLNALSGSPAVHASAEVYDPISGGFSPAANSMGSGRYYHSAVRLANGKVLVVGGVNASGAALATAELYDPATRLFSPTGSMSTARQAPTATLLPDGKVLVAGGRSGTTSFSSAELYDPSAGLFAPVGSMSNARSWHTASSLSDGRVLLVGSPRDGPLAAGTQLYNPTSGSFSASGALAAARWGHTATVLANGSVLVTGGYGPGNAPLATSELYVPAAGANSAPSAVNDVYGANEDTTLNVSAAGVLANDSDPDGNALTALLVTSPAHGGLTLSANGSFSYVPASNYFGPDSFSYKANDGLVDSNVATVSITVNPVNDPPSFVKGSDRTVSEDAGAQSVAGWATAVSAGPPDEAGQTLTFAVTNDNNALFSAQPAVASNGNLSFTPAPNAYGSATVVLYLTDNGGTANGGSDSSTTQTFVINVVAANDAPVANDDSAATNEDTSVSINVLANDSDADGNLSASALVSGPSHGQLVLNANGSFTYHPDSNYYGPDAFTYRAVDAAALQSGVATVRIIVNPVNDVPYVSSIADQTTNEDTATAAIPFSIADVETPAGLGAWTARAALPEAAGNGGGAVVNGVLYVAGGANGASELATLNAYYPASNTWVAKTPRPRAARMPGVGVVNGIIYVVGGWDLTHGTFLNNVDAYDPATDTWTARAPMPTARSSFGVAVVDNTIYAIGGTAGAGNLLTVEAFDPAGAAGFGTWTPKASLPAGHGHYLPAVGVLNGRIYVAGSDNGGGSYSNIVDSYDPATGLWSTKAPMLTPTSGAAFGVLNGNLYVAGGRTTGYQYTRVVQSYDPLANSWTNVQVPMISDRGDMASAMLHGTLYAIGGYRGGFLATNEALAIGGLVVSATSSDTTIVPVANIAIGGSGANRTVTITPASNQNGTATIGITVADPDGDSSTILIELTVNAVNDPPVVVEDNYSLDEDTVLDVPAATGVLANDSDVEGNLVAVLQTPPSHGSVTLSPDGSFRYSPWQNYSGRDTFFYAADDGSAPIVQRVDLTVNPVQDPPSITDLTPERSTNEDTPAGPITFSVSDPDGDTVTVAAASSNPALVPDSNVVIGGTGNGRSMTITPLTNQNGSTTITLTAGDGQGGTATGTLVLTVSPVNDPPVANSDSAMTIEDAAVSIDVLANDTDVEGGALTAALVTGPAQGTVATAGGALVYTPGPNYNGSDTFTYRAVDSSGAQSNIATVSISVAAVNDPPVAGDDSYTLNEDAVLPVSATGIESDPAGSPVRHDTEGPVLMGVLANDSDVEGSTLNAIVMDGPIHGILTLSGNGSFVYTPAPDFNGTDSFTYKANDGSIESNVASVSLSVNPVNDAPSFVKGADRTVAEDAGAQSVAGWATGISAGPPDEAGQTLTFVATNDNNALFSAQPAVSSNGSLTFTPAANANGSATVSVVLIDDGGTANGGSDTSAAQTFVITVFAINDRPSFVEGSDQTVAEDSGSQVVSNWATGISAGPPDEAGQTLAFIVTNDNIALFSAQPAITPDGSMSFTPAPNAYGSATVTVVLQDSGGTANGGSNASAPQTFVINVTPVNDAPVAANDSYVVDEDSTVVMPVLANDSDVDGNLDATSVTVPTGPAHGTTSYNPLNGSISYTPNPNYYGSDALSYRVCDSAGACSSASVDLEVTNTREIALDDYYVSEEDRPLIEAAIRGVLANDSDPQATAVPVSSPEHGTLTLNADGSFAYNPVANYNGADSFTYKINDGGLDSNVATVRITVTPVNDAPVAADDSYSTNEDSPLSVGAPGVLGNDFDVDGNLATAVLAGAPSHGNLTLNGDGSFTYAPEANFNGADSFTYRTGDTSGLQSNLATVNIVVNAINDPPSAVSRSLTTPEDTALAITLAGTDPDGDPLTYSAGSPSHGVLSGAYPNLTYTPAPNFNGSDSFSFTVSDGHGGTGSGVVNIIATPVSDPPVANSDTATTNEDTSISIDVLANDTDVEGEALSAAVVTGPTQGTVVAAGGVLVYTPGPNYNGSDTFTYRAVDSSGAQSNVATVNVTVNPMNDAPNGIPDECDIASPECSVNEDTILDVPAPGVLGNDTDIEGDPLTAQLVTGPAHGTITLNPNGSYRYIPELNFNGPDGFSYKANDGGLDSNVATVRITVNPVNDAPNGIPDECDIASPECSVNEDSILDVPAPGVLGNDTDIEGDPLTAQLVTGPAHGTITLSPNGSYRYTPELNFNGPDGFSYKANDGAVDSNVATVRITVIAVNDAPVANGDAAATSEDTSVTVAVLANDTDVDGDLDPTTVTVMTGPAHGTAAVNAATGAVTYSPNANYNGTDFLTYHVCDRAGACDDTGVAIAVSAVNDAPVIVPLPDISLPEGSAFTVILQTSDPELEPLLVNLAFSVSDTSVVVTFGTSQPAGATSTVVQSPHNFQDNGIYPVAVTVRDASGGSVTDTFFANVTNVSPTVAINGAPATSPEGTPITLTSTITDPGSIDTHTYAWTVTKDGTVVATGSGTGLSFTPGDDGNYVVSLAATDDDGGSGRDAKAISVFNPAPWVSTVMDAAIDEGADPDAVVEFGDDDGMLEILVDWGDGTTNSYGVHNSSFSHSYFRPSHAFGDNGTYTVRVNVDDGDGGTASTTNLVTVHNVSPTVAINGAPLTAPEGTTAIDLTSAVTDPGANDAHTYSWAVTKNGVPYTMGSGASFSFIPDDDGTYVVSLTVTDDDGGAGTDTKTINVVNVAPTINLPTTGTVDEGSTFTLLGSFTDPGTGDSHTVTIDWGDDSPPAVRISEPGTISSDHTFVENDNLLISVTVIDDIASTTATTVVTVRNVSPTVMINGTPTSSPEGAAINLTSTVSDPGASDTHTYAWTVTKNGAAYATGSNAALNFTPSDEGIYVASLTVTDDDGGAGTDTKTVTVFNVSPQIIGIADSYTIDEGSTLAISDARISDPGFDHFEGCLAPTGGACTERVVIAPSGQLNLAYAYADNGVFNLLVSITDGDGGVATATSVVTVRNVSPSASIDGAPDYGVEGRTIELWGGATDPFDNTFTWQWSVTKNGAAYSTGAGANFSFIPDDNGTYAVSLAVTDDDGGVGTTTQVIDTVNVAPTAVVLVAGPDSHPEGTAINVTGVATDPGTADTQTYAWTATKNGSPYATGLGAMFSFIPDDNGTFVVSLTVTDDDGGVGTTTQVIDTVNVAPASVVLAAASDSHPEGTAINVTGVATDPGTADTLTYAWTATKNGSPYGTGAGATFSFTPDDNGSYAVSLTVADDDGAAASQVIVIDTVNVAPTAVVLVAGPDSHPEGTAVNVTGAVTDAGSADSFIYAWTATKNGSPYAEGSAATFSFIPDDNGTYAVTLTVTDDDGESGSDTKTINVTNVVPSLDAPATGTTNEGAAFNLTGSFSDPGTGDTHTLSINWGDGSPLESAPAAGGTFSRGHRYGDNGTYGATLQVTDDECITTQLPTTCAPAIGTTLITVHNVSPTVTINGAPATSPEGTAIDLTSAVTDVVSDTHTYNWAVTKNGVPYTMGNGANFSFAPDDDGTYEVTVTVTDDDGGNGTQTKTIAVTNVAPTGTLSNSGPVSEGSPATVSFSNQADPSGADAASLRYAYDCRGNLITTTYADGSAGNTVTCVYDDNGTYTVRARIIDKDGGFSDYDTTVTVSNVSPTGTLSNSGPVSEGSPATVSFSNQADPSGADAASLRYGYDCRGNLITTTYADGSTGNTVACVYDDNGTYTVRARIIDKDGGFSDYDTTVTVNNISPLVGALADEQIGAPTAGALVKSGSFMDPGADTWAGTVDYGDGSGPQPLALNADKTFGLSHRYTANGSYAVLATVTDDDGGIGSAGFNVLVDLTPPVITPIANGTLGDNGWYVSDVSVSWNVVEADSTVTSQSGCQDSSIATDTAGTTFTCSASSLGGTSSQSIVVKRDTADPDILARIQHPAGPGTPLEPNEAGWFSQVVAAHFDCADALAGIYSCTNDVVLGEGSDQSVVGTAYDNAGNTSSTTVSHINVDLTPPAVSYSGGLSAYTVDMYVDITCNAADALSGIASTTCQNISGPASAFAAGPNAFSATATDNAGNVGAGSTTFEIIVTADGVIEVINQLLDSKTAGGLIASVNSIASAPNATAQAGQLKAFYNKVDAQTGKQLTPEEAALLKTLAGSLGATCGAAANATPCDVIVIPPGEDASEVGQTFVPVAIPADFFQPGSEPFDGLVLLGGSAGSPDTIVRRLDTIVLSPTVPVSDRIPIELVSLSLVSVQPITIKIADGSQTQWNVQVTLPVAPVAPAGTMTVIKTHDNGGTFTSQLYVFPRFTFTNVAGDTVEFENARYDYSNSGLWDVGAEPASFLYEGLSLTPEHLALY